VVVLATRAYRGSHNGHPSGAVITWTLLPFTSFANPAITVGRIFSDTFAGIAPASAAAFVSTLLIGSVLAILLIRGFYPIAAVNLVADPHPATVRGTMKDSVVASVRVGEQARPGI
jgi:hypothetical protein